MVMIRSTKKNLVKIPGIGKIAKVKKVSGGKLAQPKSLKLKAEKKVSNKNVTIPYRNIQSRKTR